MLTSRSPFRFGHGPGGFSLVEVTFALGIAAFCLVLLLALLPTGLSAIQAGEEETIALQRLGALIADIRATPLPPDPPQNGPRPPEPSIRYGLDLSGGGSGGTTNPAAVQEILLDEQGNKVSSVGSSRYRVGYRVAPRLSGEKCSRLYLRISWPGAAPAAHSQGMSEIFTTINRDS